MWMHWLMIFCEVAPQGCTGKLQEPKSLEHNDSRCPVKIRWYRPIFWHSATCSRLWYPNARYARSSGWTLQASSKICWKIPGFSSKSWPFCRTSRHAEGWTSLICAKMWRVLGRDLTAYMARIGPVASSKLGFQRISLLQNMDKNGTMCNFDQICITSQMYNGVHISPRVCVCVRARML